MPWLSNHLISASGNHSFLPAVIMRTAAAAALAASLLVGTATAELVNHHGVDSGSGTPNDPFLLRPGYTDGLRIETNRTEYFKIVLDPGHTVVRARCGASALPIMYNVTHHRANPRGRPQTKFVIYPCWGRFEYELFKSSLDSAAASTFVRQHACRTSVR